MSASDNSLPQALRVVRRAANRVASWLVAAIVVMALPAPLAAPIVLAALSGFAHVGAPATDVLGRVDLADVQRPGVQKVATP